MVGRRAHISRSALRPVAMRRNRRRNARLSPCQGWRPSGAWRSRISRHCCWRCAVAGSRSLAVIWQRMEPLSLARAEALSVTVLDRNDRLLRAYTAADGRWRLPVEVKDVDPRYLAMLLAFEDRRFRTPSRRRPLAIGRAGWLLAAPSPHRLGRLDAHHAGGAPARRRARAHGCRQAAPGAARAGSSSASCPRTRSCASTCASRPSAATSKACARPRSPTSARSRAVCRWPRRRCWSPCRSRRSCAGRTASRRPRGAPATACWPHAAAPASSRARRRARAMAERMPTARREFPMLAPHLADAEVEQAKSRSVHRLTIDAAAQANLEQLVREHAAALGRAPVGGHDRGRSSHRRGGGPRRLARATSTRARRRRRHDGAPCARRARP